MPRAAAAAASSSAGMDEEEDDGGQENDDEEYNGQAPHVKNAARRHAKEAAKKKKKRQVVEAGQVQVRYYAYVENKAMLHMCADSPSTTRTTLDRWGRAHPAEPNPALQWDEAVEAMKGGKQAPLPWQAVARWRGISFAPDHDPRKPLGIVNKNALMYWGKRDAMLTKDGTLREPVFTRCMKDLTETLLPIPQLKEPSTHEQLLPEDDEVPAHLLAAWIAAGYGQQE